MKYYVILITALAVAVGGCSKKPEAVDSAQEMGNMNATEFTLMQDPMPKTTEAEPVQSQQPGMPTVMGASAPTAPEAQTVTTTITEPTTKEIQQALKNANLYTGKIDGDLGPKTKKAIKDFQEQNGLKADGKVGPKTWLKMQPFLTQGSAEPTLTQD